MKIEEQRLRLNETPALLVYADSIKKAAEKGTILFYHGLKASKETNMKEFTSIASHGFLAVGIDSIGHGERKSEDLDNQLNSKDSFERVFIDIVRKTSQEIPGIIDELINKKIVNPEKIGVSGISMGGYVSYAGVIADRRIKAAAPILGSPKWSGSISDSPHHYPEKFPPAALLSQNAGKDESVPPKFAREFHETLSPLYKEFPEKLKYLEYPNSGHFMVEEEWNSLWTNVIEWFNRFL